MILRFSKDDYADIDPKDLAREIEERSAPPKIYNKKYQACILFTYLLVRLQIYLELSCFSGPQEILYKTLKCSHGKRKTLVPEEIENMIENLTRATSFIASKHYETAPFV